MKKNKLKIAAMSVGTIGTIVAPVASLVACGKNEEVKWYKLLPTYTGQADQLIALGIKADYYPVQLDQSAPFEYLTNPSKFMIGQSDDFKKAFASKIKSLLPSDQGTSWWNQTALQDGEKGSNPEYWTHRGGDMVLYEHYLLDDGVKTIDSSLAPKHFDNNHSFVQTNFRQSRDPYTRMTRDIIEGLLDEAKYNDLKAKSTSTSLTGDDIEKGNVFFENEVKFIDQMLKVARDIEGTTTGKAGDGQALPSGKPTKEADDSNSWVYNDFVFARNYHINFLDNTQFQGTSFKDIVLDSWNQGTWIFDKNQDNNKAIARLFYASTYQASEETLKQVVQAQSTAQGTPYINPQMKHHPIYDQQVELAAAPMFEGAMRDNSLYLYDLASKITNATTQDTSSEAYKNLEAAFASEPEVWAQMQNALKNADTIQTQLKERMTKIKVLVDKLGNPTFGFVSIAPGGGVSTIQTSSKYSFLYRELGFTQPIPTNIGEMTKDADAIEKNKAVGGTSLFNMDDNGWWWNISSQNKEGESIGVEAGKTDKFKGQFDYGVLTANDAQYNELKDVDKNLLKGLWKSSVNLDDHKVDYNLWNEGLKTPFVMHMILDKVVDLIKDDYKKAGGAQAEIDAANNWGSYFTTEFIK